MRFRRLLLTQRPNTTAVWHIDPGAVAVHTITSPRLKGLRSVQMLMDSGEQLPQIIGLGQIDMKAACHPGFDVAPGRFRVDGEDGRRITGGSPCRLGPSTYFRCA